MELIMGLFDGLFGFGGFTSPGQPMNGFPTQEFRNDSFASFMNPMQNFMPATRSYMDEMQNIPRYEDHKAGIGRTIGAALAGLAAGIGNPNAGAGVASSIVNQPYMRAMGDFAHRAGGLQDAAKAEQGLAGLARQFSNDAFQRSQFGAELGLKNRGLDLEGQKLTQQGALGNREIDVKDKALQNQMQQAALDRALQEKKISIDQHQAESQRLNALTNQKQGEAQANYWNQLGQAKLNPPDKNTPPSAALLEMQAGSRIQTDPILSNPSFMSRDNDGNRVFDPQKAMQNPQAAERLMQIYRDLGLLGR
jgi:hypothetical protein